MRLDRGVVYSAASASFLLSYIIHHPALRGRVYSDIVSFWYRGFLQSLEPPYLKAGFEYPPLAGLITYAAALGRDIITYYTVFSLIIFLFYLIMVELVVRVCSERGVGMEYVLIFLVLSPSMILYSIYNFDVIFASLLFASVYALERGRLDLSAAIFSMAALAKLINIIALPFILMHIDGWGRRIRYAALALAIFGFVNIALWALNPDFIRGTYIYHLEWGLENAWFIALFPSRDSWGTAKLFSAFLMGYSLLKIYLHDFQDIYTRVLAALSAFLLSSYVFTPQMALWILPFLAILGSIPVPYFFFELSNSAIILTWFEVPNPTELGALPQSFAMARAIFLFLLLLDIFFSRGGSVKSREGLPAEEGLWP